MGLVWKMKAVSNSGPILHIREIDSLKVFKIFKAVYIPEEVYDEVSKNKPTKDAVKKLKNMEVLTLNSKYKDMAKMFSEEFYLDLGETEAIALAMQEKINLFVTDDLEARTIAKKYDIEVHGSVGILLRAFKEKVLTKQEAIKKVHALYEKSSLFITKDLINHIIKEIKKIKIK